MGYLVAGMRPPRPPPARKSKSGLFSSRILCFVRVGIGGGGGGCHRGLTGRSEMEVKWLISLVVGELGPSSTSSSGVRSPLPPGISALGRRALPALGPVRFARGATASGSSGEGVGRESGGGAP